MNYYLTMRIFTSGSPSSSLVYFLSFCSDLSPLERFVVSLLLLVPCLIVHHLIDFACAQYPELSQSNLDYLSCALSTRSILRYEDRFLFSALFGITRYFA